MVEEQPNEETIEEATAEPEEAVEASAPAKKLTLPQRVERLEDILIKSGVVDAGSLGR